MNLILSSNQLTHSGAENDHADVIVHLHARVIAPNRARRAANGWLTLEVGDRMLAGEPELLVGETLIWRVPVRWTSPTRGVLAQNVGQVMIDAVSGEILSTTENIEEMQQRVAAFAQWSVPDALLKT